jgi:WD40 repeat protein
MSSFALSPDRTTIALGGSDGAVQLWDVETGGAAGGPYADSESLVGSVAIDDGNRTVAAVSADGTTLWNAENGDVIAHLNTGLGREAIRVAFNPDGSALASASLDSVVRQWDPQTGERVGKEFAGHGDMVLTVAYSPDGRRLASGGVDRTVRLWDVASGGEVGDPLRGHAREVFTITFSPDGRTIASGSLDGTVRLWPATASPEDLCAKLTQNMSRKQWNEWVSPDIDYIQTCPGLPIAAD